MLFWSDKRSDRHFNSVIFQIRYFRSFFSGSKCTCGEKVYTFDKKYTRVRRKAIFFNLKCWLIVRISNFKALSTIFDLCTDEGRKSGYHVCTIIIPRYRLFQGVKIKFSYRKGLRMKVCDYSIFFIGKILRHFSIREYLWNGRLTLVSSIYLRSSMSSPPLASVSLM